MAQATIMKVDNQYYFDAGDGSEAVQCKVWLEKSKANEAHPDGKPWILLPKDNPTNRRYFSEDLFETTNINGEVTVEVKTTPPRILGATGVKQSVVKYLSDEEATEYTELVENAVAEYKERKQSASKKPEDMTTEQLEEYIEALRTGAKYSPTGDDLKSFLDVFTTEQYDRYNELLALSAENKANAPRAPRKPLTPEQKAERAAKRTQKEIAKAEALLAALRGDDGNDEEADEEDA
jgi:hypothetical protein